MHAVELGDLLRSTNWLGSTTTEFTRLSSAGMRGYATKQAQYDGLKSRIEFVRATAKRLGFKGIATQAEYALKSMSKYTLNPEGLLCWVDDDARNFFNNVRALAERMPADLDEGTFLSMPFNKIEFYEPDEPLFGSNVSQKFKRQGNWEISEAGKCLALGRDTACVFHLMRTVEIAIEALRKCLGLPAPTKGQHKAWGAALERFRCEIEKRNSDLLWPRQWTSNADKAFFEQVYMMLMAIKDGCRDDTMHIESTYTESEARHLFALTKGFMEKIASRLDEDGQPLA